MQPGQLIFAGFPEPQPPPELLQLISQGRVGGVVLFARNLQNPEQVAKLVRTLHQAAPKGAPLLVSIDQEGGRVQRLRDPWTIWPPMQRVGAQQDLELTQTLHRQLGQELADLGIELNFAPVADVATRPDNPVIGDRSFSDIAGQVSDQVKAAIAGLHAAGVASCAKHFPGHGDTDLDSHLALPRLPHDLGRLERVEWPPFRAAIEAKVASIMTAHVVIAGLDAKRPATLSPKVLGYLRHELGYQGLIFSDDLEMKAVADHFSVRQRCIGALEAGVDALLICSEVGFWREALAMVEKAPDALVEGPITRMAALKARFCRANAEQLPRALPPYPEHQALARSLRPDA